MVQSLVDNLRPVSRVQTRPVDYLLRTIHDANLQAQRGNSTVQQWEMSAFASYTVQIEGGGVQLALEGSQDGFLWTAVDYWMMGRNLAPIGQSGQTTIGAGSSFFTENNGPMLVGGNRQTRLMRLRVVSTITGSACAIQTQLSQHTLHPPRTTLLGPDDTWSYTAPVGGIATTTPVVLKAAINAYHRNLITRLDLSNGGATGTEVFISDGATVVWRAWLAPGASLTREFNPPLRASANSALSLTLSAASGAAVYANVQGLVGLA